MSDGTLQRPAESAPVALDMGQQFDLFDAAEQAPNGDLVVPSRRIKVADFATTALLSVSIMPRKITGASLELWNDPDRWLDISEDRNLRFLADGTPYAQKNIYPFNPDGYPIDAFVDTQDTLGQLQIVIAWDDDTDKLFDIEDKVKEELGKRAETIDGGESAAFRRRVSELTEQAGLQFVDPRAELQTIALKIGNMILVSRPDEEDWIIQQCYASSALYDSYGTGVGMTSYYDKLVATSPDLQGFIGAPLIVPLDLEKLKQIELAFVEPASVQAIFNPEAPKQITQ